MKAKKMKEVSLTIGVNPEDQVKLNERIADMVFNIGYENNIDDPQSAYPILLGINFIDGSSVTQELGTDGIIYQLDADCRFVRVKRRVKRNDKDFIEDVETLPYAVMNLDIALEGAHLMYIPAPMKNTFSTITLSGNPAEVLKWKEYISNKVFYPNKETMGRDRHFWEQRENKKRKPKGKGKGKPVTTAADDARPVRPINDPAAEAARQARWGALESIKGNPDKEVQARRKRSKKRPAGASDAPIAEQAKTHIEAVQANDNANPMNHTPQWTTDGIRDEQAAVAVTEEHVLGRVSLRPATEVVDQVFVVPEELLDGMNKLADGLIDTVREHDKEINLQRNGEE